MSDFATQSLVELVGQFSRQVRDFDSSIRRLSIATTRLETSRPRGARHTTFGLSALPQVAQCAVFLLSLCYAAGWCYLYGLYTRFGLRVTDLGMTFQEVCVYSLAVFSSNLGTLSLMFSMAIMSIVVLSAGFIRARTWLLRRPFLVFCAVLMTYGAICGLALRTGATQASKSVRRADRTYPFARAFVNPGSFPSALITVGQDLAAGRLKLLLQNGREYYFFAPVDSFAAENQARDYRLSIFVIPHAAIQTVEVQHVGPSPPYLK